MNTTEAPALPPGTMFFILESRLPSDQHVYHSSITCDHVRDKNWTSSSRLLYFDSVLVPDMKRAGWRPCTHCDIR